MRTPTTTTLSLKIAIVVSFAAAAAAGAASTNFSPPRAHRSTVSDLLSLLVPNPSSSSSTKLDPVEARDLRSCFKFLVPFVPSLSGTELDEYSIKRRRMMARIEREEEEEEDELIWSPPGAVLEIARLAFDSGGDVGVIHRALDPTMIPVPDVEDSKEDKCVLTRTPYGRHFINKELNSYIVSLFQIIASRGPTVGLNVSLNRYDLFHGHMFINTESGRLGILFHAKEYPAYDKESFPYNMGYCQVGSNVPYDDEMNLRNILWLAPLPSNSSKAWVAPGVLVVLDARPDGIIYKDLIPEYVQYARTLYEDDFGEVVVDVNYLNVGGATPNYQLFIC